MTRPTLAFFLCASLAAQTQPATPVSAHIQRMAEVGRLWGQLKWVHPALAEGKVEWDKALVEALPEIAAAETPERQKAVITKFMASLQDPAFRVGTASPSYLTPLPADQLVQWLPGHVALLSLNQEIHAWNPAFAAQLKAAEQAMDQAEGVIVDLRPGESTLMNDGQFLKQVLSKVMVRTLALPGARFVYNNSYPPEVGYTSGGYFTAWMTLAMEEVPASPGARRVPLAFVINEWTEVPLAVQALQKAGLAYLVADGEFLPCPGVPTITSNLWDTLNVTWSSGELAFADGTTGFGADRMVPAGTQAGPGSPAIQGALELLAGKSVPGSTIHWRKLSTQPRWAPDAGYPETSFPPLPWRQLAVIKLWSVMDAFFPYLEHMDRPWQDALAEFLGRMESVQDAPGYLRAIAEMAARLQDNHVRVRGLDGSRATGEAALPIRMAMVEDKVLVNQVLDPQAAGGLQVWDEILEVDGEPVNSAIPRLATFIASANPWTRDRNVLSAALGWGGEGTLAQLKVRSEALGVHAVSLKRSKTYIGMDVTSTGPILPKGEVIRALPGNIGYADLGRLERGQVDELFERNKDAKALILDMRGYPKGTAWSIAPRLNGRNATVGARFQTRTLRGDSGELDASVRTFETTIPRSEGKPVYRGKVVMLINENTLSQAEHTGLMLESVCDLTYVGSPSAGSNGDVTSTVLPGGIRVSFTGQGARHADGRQLQRLGLQPHIAVRPTVKGVRAGRDEVLERAIAYLQTGK